MESKIGAYEVHGTIADTTSSIVYLADETELRRRGALKKLKPVLTKQTGFRERLRGDAKLMARLDHPNCVTVWELFDKNRSTYLAEELVPGASLRAVVVGAGRLTPEQALGVLRSALSGLAHAHSLGLMHGALKPENILATIEGTPKLVDFGLHEPGDVRGDVQAAGAVLSELLTGGLPAGSVGSPELPEGVGALLEKARAESPDDRFRTAGEFLAALEAAAEDAYGAGWEASSSIGALVAAPFAASGFAALLAAAPSLTPPPVADDLDGEEAPEESATVAQAPPQPTPPPAVAPPPPPPVAAVPSPAREPAAPAAASAPSAATRGQGRVPAAGLALAGVGVLAGGAAGLGGIGSLTAVGPAVAVAVVGAIATAAGLAVLWRSGSGAATSGGGSR